MLPKSIHVCCGEKCSARGPGQIKQTLKSHYAQNSARPQPQIDFCGCLGYCEQAPNVSIDEQFVITNAKTSTIVQKINNNEMKKMTDVDLNLASQTDILGDLF